MSIIRVGVGVSILILAASTDVASQQSVAHRLVPLKKFPADQVIEMISGDPATPGAPYVIRIHNDTNYAVMAHTHPEDEHIVVVQGTWSLGMGNKFDRNAVDTMELGTYGLVPKQMTHFAWSKTETIIQVHGIGPFTVDMIAPLYELTPTGVIMHTTYDMKGTPGRPAQSPAGCFTLALNTPVRSAFGNGTIVGAECTPSIQFTQYRVRKEDGQHYWATREQLSSP